LKVIPIQRHGARRTQNPRAEFTVFADLRGIDDAAHRDIGESIHDTRRHHHQADDGRVHAHNVGIELKQEARGQDKGKIIGYIAEGIADLVPNTEGTDAGKGVLAHSILLFSF